MLYGLLNVSVYESVLLGLAPYSAMMDALGDWTAGYSVSCGSISWLTAAQGCTSLPRRIASSRTEKIYTNGRRREETVFDEEQEERRAPRSVMTICKSLNDYALART